MSKIPTWIIVSFLVLAGMVAVYFINKPAIAPTPTELVIQDGREYQVISFGSVMQGRMPCYLITFAYPDEIKAIASEKVIKELRRGTILVPKVHLQRDDTLGCNRIVWNKPVTMEGVYYHEARWHPGHILPADEIPQIRQERPLVRPKR